MSSPEETTVLSTSNTEAAAGVTRKSVLQASAWIMPVVAVAIAAPAASASQPSTSPEPTTPPAPPTATLLVETFRSNRTDDGRGVRNGIKTAVQVRNNYHFGSSYSTVSQPVQQVRVDITYPSGANVHGDPVNLTGKGWSFVASASGDNDSIVYTFLYVGVLEPSKNTGELEFKVNGSPVMTTLTQGMVASAPNADTVSGPPWTTTIY
jgi:hypothetical protein